MAADNLTADVVLVNPAPESPAGGDHVLKKSFHTPPEGLCYLAACLRREGVSAAIVDSAGNRTKKNLSSDTVYYYDYIDRMTKRGNLAIGWDYWGNMTSVWTHTYAWDDGDRLTKFDRVEGPTAYDATYGYLPGSWKRYKRVQDTTVEYYVYDGDNVVGSYASNGTLNARYVSPGLDSNLSMTTGGSQYYYFQDGLGSVRNVVDSSEVAQNTYNYRAFGDALATTSNVTSPYRFTAREHESGGILDTHYYRNRYYLADLGIFLSRDAMGAGYHRGWGYVANRPTSATDPYGWKLVVKSGAHFAVGVLNTFQSIVREYAVVGVQPIIDTNDWRVCTMPGTRSLGATDEDRKNMEYFFYVLDASETGTIQLSSPDTCITYPDLYVFWNGQLNMWRYTWDGASHYPTGRAVVPPAAALWHEVLGHVKPLLEGKTGDDFHHPWHNDWNFLFGTSGTRPLVHQDPILKLENWARKRLNKNNALRYPLYYKYRGSREPL